MSFCSGEIDRRLSFFAELLSYDSGCCLWTYSSDGTVLRAGSTDLVLEKMFRSCGCFDYMMQHGRTGREPLLMGSRVGLVWGAVFEQEDDRLSRIHVLGPAFTQRVSTAQIEKLIWGKVTAKWKGKYMKVLERIPVLSIAAFSQRLVMMQFCLTGQRIAIGDIVMQRQEPPAQARKQPHEEVDRIQVYMAEQALYSMIRNGDSNYADALQSAGRVISGSRPLSADPLQHAKLGQVQFAALCCSAAMEGGLSAETAYTRKDAYIRAIEQAQSIAEITGISRAMYEDYITLVHRQRVNPRFSKAVQSSIDYIENHLHEKLTVDVIAARVGYSDYYLSRLFKKETGFSMDEYARNARIERAKILLTASGAGIQEIAEELGFSGRNYFSVIFRQVTGIPPAQYRKQYRKL